MERTMLFLGALLLVTIPLLQAEPGPTSQEPRIVWVSPDSDTIVRGKVKFEFALEGKIRKPVVYSGVNILGKGRGIGKSRFFIWRTTAADDGEHYISIEGKGPRGIRVVSDEILVIVDNTPPKVNFEIPKKLIKGKIKLSFKAQDENGIQKAVFLLDAQEVGQARKQNGEWQFVWDTTDISEGTHQFTLKVYDVAGNVNEISNYVSCDLPPLKVTLHSPVDQQVCSGTLAVVATVEQAEPINAAYLFVNDQQTAQMQQEKKQWQVSWRPPQEGRYKVWVKVLGEDDRQGESAPVNIIYDTTPPTVKLIQPTTHSSNAQNIKIQAQVTDNLSGIERVILLVNGKPAGELKATDEYWAGTWEPKEEGQYQLAIKAIDRASLSHTSETVLIKVDRQPPQLKFMTKSKQLINGPLQIQVHASDTGSGLDQVTLLCGDVPITCSQTKGDIRIFKWTPPKDGEYLFTLKATDQAGNQAQITSSSFTVDMTPPAITLRHIRQVVTKITTLHIRVHDSNQVAVVRLLINGHCVKEYQQPSTEELQYRWIPPRDGTYQLIVQASDQAGNQAKPLKHNLQVKYGLPVVELVYPQPKQIITGTITLRAKVHEPDNTRKVLFWLNQHKLGEDANSQDGWSCRFDSRKYPDGPCQFMVQGIGYSGKQGQKFVCASIIDNHPPQVTGSVTPKILYGRKALIRLKFYDKGSGWDPQAPVQVYLLLQGRKIHLQGTLSPKGQWQGKLLLGKSDKGRAQIQVCGVKDRAGLQTPATIVAQMEIKQSGGPWPLAPVNQPHAIYAGYGHLLLANGHPRLLNGLGFVTKPNTAVLAVEPGRIIAVQPSGPGMSIQIQQQGGKRSWKYQWLELALNPSAGRNWQVGDYVSRGAVLGWTMSDPLTLLIPQELRRLPNPLVNPSRTFLFVSLLARRQQHWYSVANPLRYLQPNQDQQPPYIQKPLLFRPAAEEGQRHPHYIKGQRPVLSGRVDIIAYAADHFNKFPDNLPVTSIGFAIKGPRQIPFQRLIDLRGSLPPVTGIYEHQLAASQPGKPLPYILTNASAWNPRPQHAWNTKARLNRSWHTFKSASYPAVCKFPEGEYEIVVQARDLAGNTTELTQKVLVDNFNPLLLELQLLQGERTIYKGYQKYEKGHIRLIVEKRVPASRMGNLKALMIFSEAVRPESVKLYFKITPQQCLYFEKITPLDQSRRNFSARFIISSEAIPLLFNKRERILTVQARDLTGKPLAEKPNCHIKATTAAERRHRVLLQVSQER